MIANFMTWNTGLFMYGNRFGKKPVLEITDSKYEEIFTHIRNFLDQRPCHSRAAGNSVCVQSELEISSVV